MKFVLALDQGTTSSRALLFDSSGRVVGMGQRETRQHFPAPGWVEQDGEEIWQSQLAVAQEAIARAGIEPGAIAALGITNQRETTLLWDRATGQPLHRAIVWQDRRTADLCEDLRQRGLEAEFRTRTGLLLDPYFSGTKLRWLLDTLPGAQARAQAGELAFGTVDSWLIWNLTGGRLHVTDASNASRTLLYGLAAGDWDDALLGHLRIPRAVLPRVVPSLGVLGETKPAFFGAAVPIAGVAGDQQAALFGQRCVRPGMVKNTYGTGCFMLMHTGERAVESSNRLLSTVAWRRGERTEFALEGSVFVAGAVVQWLRDGLGLIRAAEDVETLAASVSDNGGIYLVPAFTGLGAPHWDPYARGAIMGITRGTSAGHLARAALEGIAYQTADVIDAMRGDSGIALQELRVDGGATRNDLLMQFQADILGVPVVRPKVLESTALGAATLAGVAVQLWGDEAELDARWEAQRVFQPRMSEDQRTHLRNGWRAALQRSTGWTLDAG